ncbi:endonuclease 8-like 2 isoform X2 [Anolis carolinensis]|uniref:Endonuclease 8-like 2 n=1 Tax=Anolis carolinensis TaxID=28377 RepID=H9G5P2_ANOCA|nr:PREDICTED: endonuclease 8-like 2 isoform X2 [Anolis carolinensis]|eukprot:XP_008120693.1 PREDICTED: endonuclease 8-like 2 isoform X2 [Anolis carolinensis]
MPEGPSVKKFQLLCSPFVGQTVIKVGGSTKQMTPNDVKTLVLSDAQVHGKKLFLAFGPPQKGTTGSRIEHSESPAGQGLTDSGSSSFLMRQEGKVADTHDLKDHLQEEHDVDWPSLAEDNADGPRKWLRFQFGLYGSIRANEFARANKANKRGDWRDPVPRLILNFEGGGFLVFYNCRIQPCSSPSNEPSTDILSPEFDRGKALEALCKPTPVCYTLLNQTYFSGLGNRIKNEALYLARIHPLSLGSQLPSCDLESLLDSAVQFSLEWLQSKLQKKSVQVHIYMRDKCPAGHEVKKEALGPPDGLKRLTWWCPQCQPQVSQGEMDMPSTESN